MAVSVLIVEDDRNIQELLQLYLEKEGYAVTVASDGGQGLAKFRAGLDWCANQAGHTGGRSARAASVTSMAGTGQTGKARTRGGRTGI